jgi:hypothetical protein
LELKNSANLAESTPGKGMAAKTRVSANNPKTMSFAYLMDLDYHRSTNLFKF